MNPPITTHIERDSDHNFRISWQNVPPGEKISIHIADTPNALYQGNTTYVQRVDSASTQAIVLDPDSALRHYFKLEFESF